MRSDGGRASGTMMKRSLPDHGTTSSITQYRVQEQSLYSKFCLACRLEIAAIPWNDENDVLLIIPEYPDS